VNDLQIPPNDSTIPVHLQPQAPDSEGIPSLLQRSASEQATLHQLAMELALELEAGHPFMEQAVPAEATSVQVNQEPYDPPAEGTPSELLPHNPDQEHEVAVNGDAPDLAY
jgi:hypothetical protein